MLGENGLLFLYRIGFVTMIFLRVLSAAEPVV